MRKITITEALNELKLYDSKINKAISSSAFIGAKKKVNEKVGVVPTDKFVSNAKAALQSVQDLIRNRNILKAAIVESNARTTLEVAGKKMTVAEAIERKASIDYDKELLLAMKSQYAAATAIVRKENEKADKKVDEILLTIAGKDTTKKLDDVNQKNVELSYRANNEFELVDPLDLLDVITAMETEIDEFESTVDGRLTLSNATTFIELDF